MMNDPFNFPLKSEQGGHLIQYSDVCEIGQSSPCVGKLAIDGAAIMDGAKFGGPYCGFNDRIFIPLLKKKFLGTYFSLAQIDLKTGRVEDYQLKENLIFLDKVEGDSIFYFPNFNKSGTPKVVKVR